MTNLVICCDGTWNNPQQEDNGIPSPTNVVKLYNALAAKDKNGIEQRKYYHPGLGGENSGLKDAVLDGALGVSIKRHICSAYFWLASNYKPGDQVFIFGFSRGAFTARSLGGLVGLGLLDFNQIAEKEWWEKTHQHYETYKTAGKILAAHLFLDNKQPLPIRFMGVWDTVGALGIPNDMEFFNLLDNPAKWRFHDTKLGKHIMVARHAMALDEKRSSFTVTRWTGELEGRDVQEKWFPGVHSDVGGGYADTGLSDIALEWMIKESKDNGLVFRENALSQLKPNPLGVLHNSFKGIFTKFRSRPRKIEQVIESDTARFDASVFRRQSVSPIEHPAYWPGIKLNLDDSHSATFDVFAREYWSPSYIYMEQGEEYVFSAQGKWQDSKDTCDWHGTEDGELTTGDIIRFTSSLWGVTERVFKQISQNRSTDFWGTKRVEKLPWFIAIGCIANNSGDEQEVGHDGSPASHQYFALPNHTTEDTALRVTSPGYFYAFPNDVWSLYANNHGSIRVTIKRVK